MKFLVTILVLILVVTNNYAQTYSIHTAEEFNEGSSYFLSQSNDKPLLISKERHSQDYRLKKVLLQQLNHENNVVTEIDARTITITNSKACVYSDNKDSYIENYYLSDSDLYIAQTRLRTDSTRQARLKFDIKEHPDNQIGWTNEYSNTSIDDKSHMILDIADNNSTDVSRVILQKDLSSPEKSKCFAFTELIPESKAFPFSSTLYDKNEAIGIVRAHDLFLLNTLNTSQISSLKISSGNQLYNAFYTENFLIIIHSYQNSDPIMSVFSRNNNTYQYSIRYSQVIRDFATHGLGQFISGDTMEFVFSENIIRFDFEKRMIVSDYILPFIPNGTELINGYFHTTTKNEISGINIVCRLSLSEPLQDSLKEGCLAYEIIQNPIAVNLRQHELKEIPLLSAEIEHVPNKTLEFRHDKETESYLNQNLAEFSTLQDTLCRGLTINIKNDYFTSGSHKWSLYSESTLLQEETDTYPEIIPQSDGDFLLIHQLTYGACTYIDTARIHVVHQKIKINSEAFYICYDSSLTLSAKLLLTEGDYPITWTKDGEIITRNQQEIEIDERGNYHATIDNPACPLSDAITIGKHKQEYVKIIEPTESYCEGDTLQLSVEVLIPSGTVSQPTQRLIGVVPDTFYYMIESNCGEYADTVILNSVQNCNEPEIYIPNAFSPNGDGINDEFAIYSGVPYDINMQIYDRWGARIFQCLGSSESCFWDGKRNKIDGNSGVYVYKIIISVQEKEYVYTGEVSYME